MSTIADRPFDPGLVLPLPMSTPSRVLSFDPVEISADGAIR